MAKKVHLNIEEPVKAGIIPDKEALEMVQQIFEH